MTVMTWADARGALIEYTEEGWDRHSCRRVWLVVRIVTNPADELYGDLVFATPSGQADFLDLEDPVLTFDNAREARMVAEHMGEPWRTLNLYDLMIWESSWTSPGRPRYRGSEKVLTEMADAWRRKAKMKKKKKKKKESEW